MTLAPPNYIATSGVQTNVTKYLWDDWDVDAAYEPLDPAFVSEMGKISHRGNIAYTTASLEWIDFRFGSLVHDQTARDYAEAAWAAIVDWRYAEYFEPPDDDWMGPVRGPLSLAIIMTVDAINRSDQDDMPSISSASISNLAKHVIDDPHPYVDWQTKIVDRLKMLFPYDGNDPMGLIVPREALDPDFNFQIGMTSNLIGTFLSGLDHSKNRFLVSPKQMIDMGFTGTPYVI